MKKIAILMSLCLTTVCLASCGKNDLSTVAEEVLDEVVSNETEDTSVSESSAEASTQETNTTLTNCIKDINSFEGTLTMSVKMQIPMTPEEKAEYEKLGNDASYAFHNINMGTELAVDTTDSVTHYKGTLSKVGQTVAANPINCYTDETAGQMYDLTYNEGTGSQVWVKSDEYKTSLLHIVSDILAHTTDITENNASSTRIIKGNVKANYVLAIPCFKHINSDYFTLDKESNTDLPIKVTINTKTGYLSALEVTLDNLMTVSNVQTFGTEPLKIVLKNTNSTNIAIPDEALNTTGQDKARVDEDISVYGKYFKAIYAPSTEEADDKIALDIVNSVLGHQYDALLITEKEGADPEYTEMLHQIADCLNYYSVIDLQNYMTYYKYSPEEQQIAFCIVAQLGIPGYDETFMQENCIGSTTLSAVIMDYMNREGLLTVTPVE